MKKPSKKSARSAPKPIKAIAVVDDDGWNGPSINLRLIYTDESIKESHGGFIGNRDGAEEIGKLAWKAEIDQEDSCCGFPVLREIEEHDGSTKFSSLLGEALKEHLTQKMVYLSTYVPDNKDYRATRAILEAAGFRPGVTLMGNDNYTNTRWEWFNPRNQQEANEKTVRPCTIK